MTIPGLFLFQMLEYLLLVTNFRGWNNCIFIYSTMRIMILRYLFCFLLLMVYIGETTAQEEGIASYYHSKFHGKKMSSGQIHSRDELVAAHRTLPFGSFVRVTNLSNMNSVIVCIADRGPFKKGWIIDVSEEAAKRLDFIRKGITKVRLEVVPGAVDLRFLELISPKMPFLDDQKVKPQLPYRLNLEKKFPAKYEKRKFLFGGK